VVTGFWRGTVRFVVDVTSGAVVSSGGGASVAGAALTGVAALAVVVVASVVAIVAVAGRADVVGRGNPVVDVATVEVGPGISGSGPGVPDDGPPHTNASVSKAATSTPMTIRATVRPVGRCIVPTVAGR
jgi:hypothetical protein